MRIILASASPRRKELLRELFHEFEIIPSDIEEVTDTSDAENLVKSLSKQKAEAVYNKYANYGDLIIGADTVVVLSGIILGKPADSDDALNMLKALSGKTHDVFTGVTIIYKDCVISCAEKTAVTISIIPDEILYSYAGSGTTMDKAGGYGLQDLGNLVDIKINGDRNNVIGLPVNMLREMLFSAGVN